MKREKDTIKKESEEHLKTLSMKLFYLKLTQLINRSCQYGINQISNYNVVEKNREKACKRIFIFVSNKEENRVRNALKNWFAYAFDFVSNNKTVMELASKKADFKHTGRFFYLWRNAYFNSLRKYDNKMESINMIKDITLRKQQWKMRICISNWKSNTEWAKDILVSLKNMIRNKQNILLKKSVETWYILSKEEKERERFSILKIHMTNIKIKQKVFSAWRLVNQETKSAKDLKRFYELKKA